jgi:hypothetical protein
MQLCPGAGEVNADGGNVIDADFHFDFSIRWGWLGHDGSIRPCLFRTGFAEVCSWAKCVGAWRSCQSCVRASIICSRPQKFITYG